jgi:hypothetical protein
LTWRAACDALKQLVKGQMMKKAIWLGLALIPGLAWAGNSAEKPQPKKADGLVCRDVGVTGSRLASQRVCMTREQWELARRDARDTVDHAQTRQMNKQGH